MLVVPRCVTTAQEAHLDWKPTPVDVWIGETVRWLDSAENTAPQPSGAPFDSAALMAKCAALSAAADRDFTTRL